MTQIFGNTLNPGEWTLLGIILALVAVFEIWMLVDVLLNQRISTTRRVWWVIGMFLIHPIIAIIYYFTDHRPPRVAA